MIVLNFRYVDDCISAYSDPNKPETYKINTAEAASKMSLEITSTIYQGEIKHFIAKKFNWNGLKMTANVRDNISKFISKKMSKKPLLSVTEKK